MPYYCTVPRCTSMAGKAKNVSFHQFPRDQELAKLWNQVLKRGKPYTKYSKVCSLHFKPEDYTITSAQKNRGQWRTLRKDAVPSQNLPSESPTDDWHRRNSSPFQSNMDINASVQHQMAQAIYVQTMLAMQVAGINDSTLPSSYMADQPSPSNVERSQNEDSEPKSMHKTKNPPEKVTYKCNECSKCFKDPDVFIIHQRNHIKSDGNTEMLKANPILANLLKNDSESVNKNVISIENQIMSALTENMANYLRNLSTIMTNGNPYATDKSDSADDVEGIDNTDEECDRDLKMDDGDSNYSDAEDTQMGGFNKSADNSDIRANGGSIKSRAIDNVMYTNDVTSSALNNSEFLNKKVKREVIDNGHIEKVDTNKALYIKSVQESEEKYITSEVIDNRNASNRPQ